MVMLVLNMVIRIGSLLTLLVMRKRSKLLICIKEVGLVLESFVCFMVLGVILVFIMLLWSIRIV